MSPDTVYTFITTMVGIVVGTVVGTLLTLFISYKVDSNREKQRNKKRLISVSRTIASEIHSHKEYIEVLLEGHEFLKNIEAKLTDTQWEQSQRDIWELSPSIGVLFRKYYDSLGKIKTKQFNNDIDLEQEFAPLLKLAKECLHKADFPYVNVRTRIPIV